MHDLSGFQGDTLNLIGGNGAPKGVKIKEGLAGYYDNDVNHGRL